VSCGDQTHCSAVGADTVISSSDGGSTWQSDSIPVSDVNLLGISCASASDCVATGLGDSNAILAPQAVVLATQDGGQTWQSATLPNGVTGLGAVSCPTTTLCLAVGSTVLQSTDGGQTWAVVGVAGGFTGGLRAISCADADNCIAVASNPLGETDPNAAGTGIVTTDGGDTWSPITLPAGTAAVQSVTCTADGCSAAGAGPTSSAPSFMVGTSTSGATWTSQQAPSGMSEVTAMTCADAQDCVAVGVGPNGSYTASTSTGPSGTWTSQPEAT